MAFWTDLNKTIRYSKNLANKIGLPLSGELIGLVHDLGKYSAAFQTYIRDSIAYDNYKDLDLDEDNLLVITRVIYSDGKSVARVNGRTVKLSILKDFIHFFKSFMYIH